MTSSPNWIIAAVKTEETKDWWQQAEEMHVQFPNGTPDALHPLFMESWDSPSVLGSSADVLETKRWIKSIPVNSSGIEPILCKKLT